MATEETLWASLVSSDAAHALRSLVEDLARRWTSNVHRCDDSSVVFEALRDIATNAVTNVAREWNSSHDVLRALPAEVQEQCFGSLPVPDRCRLSMICSHWSTNVANLPGIWTRLELENWQPALGILLARSGQLPLDVSVKPCFDLMEWDGALRSHATRLRKLEIREIYDGLDAALRFPAPHLEELSIAMEYDSALGISHRLFDQHAPRLRTLCLTSVSMPLECRAFRSVTTLTLRHTRGALDHLFEWMPFLRILDISGHSVPTNLPAMPRQSSLRVLRLVDVFVTIEQLVRLGYSELDVLSVVTTTSDTSQIADAMFRWPALATTLRIRSNWHFDTVLQPDGRRMGYGVRPCYYQIFEKLFGRRHRDFYQIQRLVLPVSFRLGPYSDYEDWGPALLSRNEVIFLPALSTLSIECSNIRDPEDMYPLRDCVLGVFEVPRLTRIEVLRAVEAPRDAPIEPVDVADLLALVQNILVCDDPASLEVFVDTASGISLIGDVGPLRACVGGLVDSGHSRYPRPTHAGPRDRPLTPCTIIT